jgi:hypothetical protein
LFWVILELDLLFLSLCGRLLVELGVSVPRKKDVLVVGGLCLPSPCPYLSLVVQLAPLVFLLYQGLVCSVYRDWNLVFVVAVEVVDLRTHQSLCPCLENHPSQSVEDTGLANTSNNNPSRLFFLWTVSEPTETAIAILQSALYTACPVAG